MYGPFQAIMTTDFFTLEEALPSRPGSQRPYYRISGQDSVICCVLDPSDRFVMIRQFRPNLGVRTLEVPAGGVEKGETPVEAARREIAEETGLRCALLPMGRNFHLMMNRTNIEDHLFLGMFPESIPGFVPEQDAEVLRLPRAELLRLAIHGDYRQIAGLGLLQLSGGILGLDMWHSPFDAIAEAFRQHPQVQWCCDG